MLLRTRAEQEEAFNSDEVTSLCRLEDAGIAYDPDDEWALPGHTTWLKALCLRRGLTLWVNTGIHDKRHDERCWELFDTVERIKATGKRRVRWRQLIASFRRDTDVKINWSA